VGSARERAIRQAHDVLRASIRRGLLSPTNPLVEFRLVRSLGVGRNIVRDVLQSLADDGLVTRRPGIGTLVAREMFRISADQVLCIDDNFRDRDGRVEVQQLAVDLVELGEVLTSTLGLATGSMRLVETLVLVDREPLFVLATYLPREVDITRMDQSYESVAVAFEGLMGRPLGRAATTVEAINADAWVASTLGVELGAAVILREQILYDAEDNVGVLSFARYRADRVAFTAIA
jgi:GntR family transcriptional regulator